MTLVISPHLDDAVLSLGGLLDQSTIVTVFAGIPPPWYWPSPFDNASGFTRSDDAVSARRDEDDAACAELRSKALHLHFLDGQYGMPRDELQIVSLLGHIIDTRPGVDVAVPLGLAHPDHRLVAKLCRLLVMPGRARDWLVYADLPSAKLWPGHIPGALRGWERAGWSLEPADDLPPADMRRKTRAVERYVSQRRFAELAIDNLTEERRWWATFNG